MSGWWRGGRRLGPGVGDGNTEPPQLGCVREHERAHVLAHAQGAAGDSEAVVGLRQDIEPLCDTCMRKCARAYMITCARA